MTTQQNPEMLSDDQADAAAAQVGTEQVERLQQARREAAEAEAAQGEDKLGEGGGAPSGADTAADPRVQQAEERAVAAEAEASTARAQQQQAQQRQQQQTRGQQFMDQLGGAVTQYRDELVNMGTPEDVADKVVEGWRHEKIETFQQQETLLTQQAGERVKLSAAMKMADESGMPIERLMQYTDPQSMRLAAEDYMERTAQDARIKALEDRLGRQNGSADPAEEGRQGRGEFDAPGGQGAGADAVTLARMSAEGDLPPNDAQWAKQMAEWGLAPPKAQ